MNPRSLVCGVVLSALFLASCATEDEKRREINEQQLQTLLQIQKKKDLVRDEIVRHFIVRSARVHFPPGRVIVEITLKSRKDLGEKNLKQLDDHLRVLVDDANRRIREITGIGKKNISLRVRPAD